MDSELHSEDAPYAVSPVDEKQTLTPRIRDYLAYLVRERPFSLQFDDNPNRVADELKRRWPLEKGREPEAQALVQRIQDAVNNIAERVHSIGNVRTVLNVSPHPDVKLPFPNAPAGLLKIDAISGLEELCIAHAKDIPLEISHAGLILLVQPFEIQMDQWQRNFNQGGNLYKLENKESNENTESQNEHVAALRHEPPHRPSEQPPAPKPE